MKPYVEEVVRHKALSVCSGEFHSNSQLRKPTFTRLSLLEEPVGHETVFLPLPVTTTETSCLLTTPVEKFY